MPQSSRAAPIFLLFLVLAMLPASLEAKKKGSATTKPEEATVDLNALSLRVTAIDMLYQFDFSDAQLKALSQAAVGEADTQPRAAGTGTRKLADALVELEDAILEGKEDAAITKLRLAVTDLVNSEDVHLDDEIKLTEPARKRAGAIFNQIRVSQLAAYLAGHANEVGDPREIFAGALDDLRELNADAASGKEPRAPDRAKTLIQQTADDIGFLVAGLDDAKAGQVADQVSAQLQSAYKMNDADFAAGRTQLEESVAKTVADVASTQILGNWIERQIGMLLSNPQLPRAVVAMTEARIARAAGK